MQRVAWINHWHILIQFSTENYILLHRLSRVFGQLICWTDVAMLLSFALRKSIFPEKSLAHRPHGYFVIVHTLPWITNLEWTLWTYKRDIVKRYINCSIPDTKLKYQEKINRSVRGKHSRLQRFAKPTFPRNSQQREIEHPIHPVKKEPVIIVILTGYLLPVQTGQ